jgi:hypothetical protein
MDLQLSGKLALVTGSTAGIGLAIGSTLVGERRGAPCGWWSGSLDHVIDNMEGYTKTINRSIRILFRPESDDDRTSADPGSTM